MRGSLAEWSKALVLATSLFRGVGSILTAGIRLCLKDCSVKRHQNAVFGGKIYSLLEIIYFSYYRFLTQLISFKMSY